MRKHLLFVVLAGVMTTACTDDLEPEVTPVGPGTFNDDIPTTGIAVDFNASSNQPEVVDEASAKILSAWTKTTNAGGSNGAMRVHYGINDDMQRALSLYWDAGDKMSIIQVARDKNTGKVLTNSDGTLAKYNYAIGDNPGNEQLQSVTVVSGDNPAMKWYANADEYRFYATYPAIGEESGIKALNPVMPGGTFDKQKKARVTVTVPKKQVCKLTGNNNDGWWTSTPDMKNCYMVGESDVYTTTEGTHTINFKPIMTTLNIGVRGARDANSVTVSGVRIYLKDASGKRIAFPDEITLNYQTLNYKQNGVQKSMVNCNYIDHAYDHSTVAGNEDIDMGSLNENSNIDPSKDNTTPYIEVRFSRMQELEPGQGAILTAFIPPYIFARGHYGLDIVPIYDQLIDESVTDNVISYGAGSPNPDTRIIIPSTKIALASKWVKVISSMDWMSRLNDNVLLKDLNIPGAHNSGQVDFRVYDNKQGYNWAEAQRQAKQVASIYEMLNAGVRALDIRPSVYATLPGNVDHYGYPEKTFYLINDGDNSRMGILQQVVAWLNQHPTETVIIMTGRQVSFGNAEGSEAALNSLRDYLMDPKQNIGTDKTTKVKAGDERSRLAWFSDGLDMKHARGKVVLIVRRNGDDTKGYWFSDDQSYTYSVNGRSIEGIGYMNSYMPNYNYTHDQAAAAGMKNYDESGGLTSGAVYNSYAFLKDNPDAKVAFDKITVKPNETSTGDFATFYFLDREIIGKRGTYEDNQSYKEGPTWGTNVYFKVPDAFKEDFAPANAVSNYYGGALYELKSFLTNDFLKMAGDPQYKDSWFVSAVPSFAYVDHFQKKNLGYTANWNAWGSVIFEVTHEPVRDFIKAHQNQRFGIVYFDFVPGKDYEGNPSFSFDVSTTYSRFIGFNSARQEISTEINNAIIESNFKRTLRTSSGN